jgi:hypothetical protein
LYKYKERIKEKKDSLYYMLSIISSGNRGCCSSTVPIREPALGRTFSENVMYLDYLFHRPNIHMGRQKVTPSLFLFVESTDLVALWWGVIGRKKVISVLFLFIQGIASENLLLGSSDRLTFYSPVT